ncbi:unnamed protein product [Phytophthora fragariaefolia]|uniref:Unnamed protein product n=1 Tax=Phytophthora fragariaefolia TaxID=1490495 RepID=A0A9W6XRP1_9STRA|nr:unnamed protein product [Phytophthora fragariaefolia]
MFHRSAKGKTKLAILRVLQSSGHYIYTVAEHMLPFAHLTHGVNFVYQQDNALIHTSREMACFLQEQEVNTMIWPARTPDCNRIENVWSTRVYTHGCQYRSVNEPDAAILEAWSSIEQEYLLKLVQSMPRRCLAVIRQKDGLSNY